MVLLHPLRRQRRFDVPAAVIFGLLHRGFVPQVRLMTISAG